MKPDFILAGVLIFCVALVLGTWIGVEGQQKRVTRHACQGACERLGSEMENQYDNTCVCANMMVMRGDYGQMFLQGRQVR